MAKRDERVLDFVREQLRKQSDLGSRDLYEMTKEAHPAIVELTRPQFHGRYYLAAKRDLAPRKDGGKPNRQKAARAAPARKQAKKGKQAPSRKAAPQPEAERAEPPRTPERGNAERGDATERERIRMVFLEFAQDFAEAESRAEIVKVLHGVNKYVDRVLERSR